MATHSSPLRTRFSTPSTYLLWTLVLLVQAATLYLLLDVLATGRPEILLGEVPPEAPLAPLFASPLTWLLMLLVLPLLALREEHFWTSFSTWVLFWTPALAFALVLRLLGLDLPVGPVLSGLLGLVLVSGLLLALTWFVAKRLKAQKVRTSTWWRLGRVAVTFALPVLLLWAATSLPRAFDPTQQLRLFSRGVVPSFPFPGFWRGDWTPSQLYRLDATSRATLDELELTADLHLVVDPSDPIEPYARELVARIARAAPDVVVRISRPDWGTASMPPAGYLRLTTTYGERTLGLDELVAQDEGKVTLFLEPAVVGALAELAGRAPRVAVSQDHGELPLPGSELATEDPAEEPESAMAPPRENLALLAPLLDAQGVRVERWTPEATRQPDLVLVAGPRTPWSVEEVRRLDAHFRQGGALWLLLDPRFGRSEQGEQVDPNFIDLGLETWLATLGVEVERNVVVDPAGRLDAVGPETFTVRHYAQHPAIRSIAGVAPTQPAVVALARSVRRRAEAPDGIDVSGVRVTELLHTSRLGWGETSPAAAGGSFQDAADLAGPVPLAVAIETAVDSRFRGGRMLVWGDASCVNDALLSRGANAQLVRYGLAWLLRRSERIAIPPTQFQVPRWDAGPAASTLGWILTLLVLAPLVATLVLWRRRAR